MAGTLGTGRAETSLSSWQKEGWVLFALKLAPCLGEELSMHKKEGTQGLFKVCQPPRTLNGMALRAGCHGNEMEEPSRT